MNERERGSCVLALEDGTVFPGRSFGAAGTRVGEVVFNTAMTGYQEVATDPSYRGQIVTMTYPHIGNYGINPFDAESGAPTVAGFITRRVTPRPSNPRATQSFHDYLRAHDIIGIEEIDTRALTRRLRLSGALRGVLTTEHADPAACVRLAREAPPMTGADWVRDVAPRMGFTWSEGLDPEFSTRRLTETARFRVVAIDCGMKRNILRHLVDLGATVEAVPPGVAPERILDSKPDGVFVSNGPGDPAAVGYAIDLLKELLGRVPIFGICLGHQLLGLALGARSFKLKFGHHGVNHPVLNVGTGNVEITSQNHGFALDVDSIKSTGAVVTHLNLNDHTLEGFTHHDRVILAVQYHPEAGPGPRDASYLFDCFARMMETGRAPAAGEMEEAQTARRTPPA